jgi:hypothetical protein
VAVLAALVPLILGVLAAAQAVKVLQAVMEVFHHPLILEGQQEASITSAVAVDTAEGPPPQAEAVLRSGAVRVVALLIPPVFPLLVHPQFMVVLEEGAVAVFLI